MQGSAGDWKNSPDRKVISMFERSVNKLVLLVEDEHK